jgi:hypothetical protein
MSLAKYEQLVTSEHNQRPKFMAYLDTLVQPSVDQTQVTNQVPINYDLDIASGVQEDTDGQWVGLPRQLPGSAAPLSDANYRLALKAKVGANNWDGTRPQVAAIWNTLFGPLGFTVLVQDPCDMSMIVAFYGPVLADPALIALLQSGYIDVRPAGVSITYLKETSANRPFFGFDINSTYVAGFDTGYFGIPI